MRKNYLLCLIGLFMAFGVHAQEQLWSQRAERNLSAKQIFREVQLSTNVLDARFRQSTGKLTLELPLPDGTSADFVLTPSSVMAPELAAKFPEIRTYNAVSRDGTMSAKVDFNGTAFYALVWTPNGLVYLDPDNRQKPDFYKSYYVKDYKNHKEAPLFEEGEVDFSMKQVWISRPAQKRGNRLNTTSGGELRTYRIAIAADSEFSQFHGGTISSVLSAMVTTMNRVNGVYENDLSITMQLIGDNDQLIFTNPTTDPYRNASDPEQFLDLNASVIDPIVGSSSYDIGHIFTTSSGGVAVLGSVCTNNKAAGTTGIGSPTGDAFDIDFVAHELGHQFGGQHTFNGTQGFCSGRNRTEGAAYEPGSGSTIMAYAGICGSDNLQSNSDPFFHAKSLDEIFEFSNNAAGNSCATITATGNIPPTVTVDPLVYTIPTGTPFQLTASGSDVDGDNLTYSWEQYDLGPAGAPDAPTGTAPRFRAYNPTASPVRTFPRLESILSGEDIFGEVLPAGNLEMNFRVVVRDNNPVGGAINTADVQVLVEQTEEPFIVTSQSEPRTSYTGGSVQEVTWNVAGTTQGEIGTQNVKILFSDNGGQSFDYTLDEMTANDGFALIRFPEVVTSEGRIKVEALNNIFFNVNDREFSLTQAASPEFFVSVDPIPAVICFDDEAVFEVSIDGTGGFNEVVTLSVSGLDATLSGTFEDNTLSPGESTTLRIDDISNAPSGENDFVLQAMSASNGAISLDVSFDILDVTTGEVTLTFPEDMSNNNDLTTGFQWSELDVADTYTFELATDDTFNNIILSQRALVENEVSFDGFLEEGTTYYWRVASNNLCGQSDFTLGQFTTVSYVRTDVSATNLNIPISNQQTPTITSVITVAEDITIEDLNIIDLDITHSYVEDLTVSLSSPSGTTVTLFSAICGSQDNVFLSFDDETSENTDNCELTSGRAVRPLSALSAFNLENAQGDWTLTVSDGADQDGGSLNGWGLEFGAVSRDVILSLGNVSSDEVELSWEEVATLDGLTGFEIDVREGDGAFQNIREVSSEAVSVTIENLTGETNYSFRVRAILGNDFSDYSNSVAALTAPGAPEGLSAVLNSFGNVIVTWTDNFSTELGFILELSEDGGEFEVLQTLAQGENSFVLSPPEFEETLSFRVKAFNQTGESPYSEEVTLLLTNVNDLESNTKLFPNPGSNFARLQIPAGIAVNRISLTDISGKSLNVDVTEETTGNYVISTAVLPAGLYFIRIQSEEETATLRWLKE